MTTTNTITQESSSHLDSAIQRKQDEILQVKQRLVRLQIELSQMKKRKASMKSVSDFREQLKAVMRPG
jgi:small-conductance mechanosensitive channel